MHELLAHAALLGVSVHVAHLDHPYRGYYDSAEKIVVYDFNLPPVERGYVLAHELGHAYHDHRCQDDQASEDAADEYAARLLIDARRYAVEAAINPDPEVLADALGVPVELLGVFERTCVQRLGRATYLRARRGRGMRLA